MAGGLAAGAAQGRGALGDGLGPHGSHHQLLVGFQQVAELDRLVAANARHRGFAAQVAVGELVDHRVLEAAFVVQDVVGDAQAFGGQARIVDVLAGAAGALLLERGAVVVEL